MKNMFYLFLSEIVIVTVTVQQQLQVEATFSMTVAMLSHMTPNVLIETRCHQTTQTQPFN